MSLVKQIPNMLTMARFVILVFATVYLFGGSYSSVLIALGLYVCVAITDFLDGYLARKLDATSEFGKLMDPIADKAYILTLFISFAFLGVISHWWVWPIVVREVVVTMSRLILVKDGCVIAAEKSGKIKTFSQNIVLAVVYVYFLDITYWGFISGGAASVFLWVLRILLAYTVFITLSSGLDYFRNNWAVITQKR